MRPECVGKQRKQDNERERRSLFIFLTDGPVSNEAADPANTYQFRNPEQDKAGERGGN